MRKTNSNHGAFERGAITAGAAYAEPVEDTLS